MEVKSMIKVKRVYFTMSVAIVLFIIIAGCISTQPHTTQTLRPITLVSAEQSGCFKIQDGSCSPAGPAFTVTLNASSTDVPVTNLSAKLMLTESSIRINYSISFTFPNINQSNPLMPNQTASATSGSVGPVDVLNVNGTPAVFIEGTLQNGQSFSYWTNETISEPPKEPPIKPLRPISVIASAQSGPPPCTPVGNGYECNPAGPPTWIAVQVNASSTDVPVIQLSTTVLDYDRDYVVCDNFGINMQHPLMPGQNASTTCGYRSLGAPVDLFIVNGTPVVHIEGTLQNGQSFSYWTNDTAP
jgi:hypothetical protein